jgi:hypothetical protein
MLSRAGTAVVEAGGMVERGRLEALRECMMSGVTMPPWRSRVYLVTGNGEQVNYVDSSMHRHVRFKPAAQVVDATQALNRSAGVANRRVLRGRSLSCRAMPKPVIAAISGTCLAGAFEFALSCDLRIAEDGDYQIGLPEAMSRKGCHESSEPRAHAHPHGRDPLST